MSSISTISSSNNIQYYDFSKYPLSEDIWAVIFTHLDSSQDVRALSLTNRSLFQIFSKPTLSFWYQLLEKHFPDRVVEKNTKLSRDVYQRFTIIENEYDKGAVSASGNFRLRKLWHVQGQKY